MATAQVAYTASQLEDQVRNLLSDNINFIPTAPDSLSPQTWSTQQIYEAFNFAIKEYCKSTNASYTEDVAQLDSNGVATLPSDYLELSFVFFPSAPIGG